MGETSRAMADGTASLRPAGPEDTEFFFAVYTSTRAEEMAATGWSDLQKAAFCRGQFKAQTRHYSQCHPAAQISVIEHEGTTAGRLYVNRSAEEIRIVDIALLPEHRGAGIGTRFLRELQREAQECGKPLTIHVERYNRALGLYQRLGFVVREDKGVYLLMEWRAPE